MTYRYLTVGKSKPQIRQVDMALLGPEGESPVELARANRAAMAALGQVGQIKPRRKS